MKRKIMMCFLILISVISVNPAYSCDGCIALGNDLKTDICAEYHGVMYGFTLNYVPDLTGFYWKMDISSFRQLQASANCIHTEDDLTLNICCANYQDVNYKFVLNYYHHPKDPFGIYWKMDVNTLGQSVVQTAGGDYSFPSGSVFYHSLRGVSSLSKDLQNYLSGFSDSGGFGLGDTIAFNRFIDDTSLGQLRGWIPKSDEPGYCNPSGSFDNCHKERMQYAYDNTDPQGNRLTIYTDNRDFVTAKKNANGSEHYREGKYYHNVPNLKISDVITVFVYIDNNASVQSVKAEARTAKNTKVSVDFSDPHKLKATISAQYPDGTNLAPISDIVSLGLPVGSKLEYSAGLLTGFTTNLYTDSARLMDEILVSPVYKTATTAEFNIGDVVAGDSDSKWLYLKFRVIADK